MNRRNHAMTLALASMLLLPGSLLRASDHLDAPNLQQAGMGDRDLNDLYAFQSPSNSDNTVLIMTVNPFAGRANPLGFTSAMSGTTFGTDVTYEFNISNAGDAAPELTYSTTFGPVVAGAQTFTIMNGATLVATGSTGGPTVVNGGVSATAGLYDDPFFFDEKGFLNGFAFTGDDTFAGYNTSAIVLEVPTTALGGPMIGIQARTVVGGTQIDRVGRPAINTALLGPTRKDAFNAGNPEDDTANFSGEVNTAIAGLPGSSQANADALTPILLPDLLTIDTSMPSGFLNGRTLEDDVIDAELGLLTGGGVGDPPAADSDMVPANDRAFSDQFPYLASPNPIPEPTTIALAVLAFPAMLSSMRRRNRA